MNFYAWHIGDYKSHTDHLTLEEDAVYRRLLDFYYDTEAPIPKETQSVIRRLRLVNYEPITERILDEFFTLKDDGWHNFRADQEIISYHGKIEAARANGKKGGRPKKNNGLQPLETQTFNSANPAITQVKTNQEPRTNNHEPVVEVRHNPPTQREVEEYVKSIGFSLDCEKFITHYKSQGWILGNGIPMADWQETINKWKLSDMKKSKESSTDANFVKEV